MFDQIIDQLAPNEEIRSRSTAHDIAAKPADFKMLMSMVWTRESGNQVRKK
jgi:hypothetical protein